MTRLHFPCSALLGLCLLVLIGWLPASAATPAQVPAFPAHGAVTTGANLRAGPGTTFERVGSAHAGQVVQIVECNDGCSWYKLDSGNWIFAELVELQSAAPVAVETSTSASVSKATAADAANLRSGPGTTYDRVGSVAAGQTLDVTGRNQAGDWYQLADGAWIAAFLVSGAPDSLSTVAAPSAEAPIADTQATDTLTQAPAEPEQPQQPAVSPNVAIRYVNYDGGVYRVESDEYAEVANTGSAPANLGGWVINAGDNGQNFTFPNYELGPGQSCRVYTNEHHQESCGFSFGRGQAIWNNKGDCGYLFDSSANQVDSYCY